MPVNETTINLIKLFASKLYSKKIIASITTVAKKH